MAICNFFLQNRCKFGDRCRFEHPRGGTQRNLFSGPSQPWQGGGGGNTWQGGGGGNTWQGSGGGNTWQGGGSGSNNWQGGGSGSNNWQGGGGGSSGSNNWQNGGGGNTWQGGGGGGGNTWQGGGGGGGGNTWQGGSSGQRVTFKDSFTTGGQAGGGQRQQGPQGSDSNQLSSTLDLINSLPKEMEIWEKSHMWPFSCFSLDKDISSLPEFNDLSPDELRFEAYQAIESGNILPYTQKVQSLQNEFQGKRRQLQNMTMDLKSKLMAVIDDARKKAQTQPVSASSSVFGSSQASQNAFGQTQASTSAGLFGRSAGAADGNSSNLFGKSTSGSVFGGNFSSRSDNSSSFASSGASLFGKAVTAGSAFGTQPQAQAAQAPNPFGPVNDSSSPKTSGLFGQPASSGPQTNALFGQAGNSPLNQSSSLFGGSAASQSPGLFGKSFPQQSANASFPVGASSPATQTSSLFGVNANQNQPPASLFGKPNPGQAAPSVFGGVASHQGQDNRNVPAPSAASVFGGSIPASTASHGLYTPLADLTEQEKEEFSAKTFTLGKIPIRPPPREMVN